MQPDAEKSIRESWSGKKFWWTGSQKIKFNIAAGGGFAAILKP